MTDLMFELTAHTAIRDWFQRHQSVIWPIYWWVLGLSFVPLISTGIWYLYTCFSIGQHRRWMLQAGVPEGEMQDALCHAAWYRDIGLLMGYFADVPNHRMESEEADAQGHRAAVRSASSNGCHRELGALKEYQRCQGVKDETAPDGTTATWIRQDEEAGLSRAKRKNCGTFERPWLASEASRRYLPRAEGCQGLPRLPRLEHTLQGRLWTARFAVPQEVRPVRGSETLMEPVSSDMQPKMDERLEELRIACAETRRSGLWRI